MTVSELYKHLQDLIETNIINYDTEVQVAAWDDGPYDGLNVVGIRTLTDCDFCAQDDNNRYKETVFIIHE